MDYKARAKNRKMKRKVQKFVSALKFNSVNGTVHHKLILTGACIVFVSLFFRWFQFRSSESENAFSSLLGVSGWIILFLCVSIVFMIISQARKESLKRILNVNFKEYYVPMIGGTVIALFIVNAIVSINALQRFSSEVELGNGLFVAISGNVFILVGGFLLKKYYEKNVKGIYSDANESEVVDIETKNNMKLPF